MQRIKNTISLLIVSALLLVTAKVALAFAPTIMTLPSYINTNNFKLSCTASGSSAQFSFRKEGGSYNAFGSAINLNTSACQVQVTSSEVNDQTRYYFKVTVDGVDSNETTTVYDVSGPSPVSNYYKEQVGSGFYKLHWRNPGDSDFAKVIIYRGETVDFSADSSHEIAQVSGGANSDMTYDEHQPDPNKTYYYAIRAVDAANNSSSLVGDGGTTTTPTTTTTGGTVAGTSGTGGSVSTLPVEQGQVLSEETAAPTPTAESAQAETQGAGSLLSSGRNKVILILGILGLGALVYYFFFRKRS